MTSFPQSLLEMVSAPLGSCNKQQIRVVWHCWHFDRTKLQRVGALVWSGGLRTRSCRNCGVVTAAAQIWSWPGNFCILWLQMQMKMKINISIKIKKSYKKVKILKMKRVYNILCVLNFWNNVPKMKVTCFLKFLFNTP